MCGGHFPQQLIFYLKRLKFRFALTVFDMFLYSVTLFKKVCTLPQNRVLCLASLFRPIDSCMPAVVVSKLSPNWHIQDKTMLGFKTAIKGVKHHSLRHFACDNLYYFPKGTCIHNHSAKQKIPIP